MGHWRATLQAIVVVVVSATAIDAIQHYSFDCRMRGDWLLGAIIPALAIGWFLVLRHLWRRKMYERRTITIVAVIATIAIVLSECVLVFFLMLSHVCS